MIANLVLKKTFDKSVVFFYGHFSNMHVMKCLSRPCTDAVVPTFLLPKQKPSLWIRSCVFAEYDCQTVTRNLKQNCWSDVLFTQREACVSQMQNGAKWNCPSVSDGNAALQLGNYSLYFYLFSPRILYLLRHYVYSLSVAVKNNSFKRFIYNYKITHFRLNKSK